MCAKKIAPVHPGEILFEEFLKPLGVSQYRLAKDINVRPRRINEIVQGKRSISADTALRLARAADLGRYPFTFNANQRFFRFVKPA